MYAEDGILFVHIYNSSIKGANYTKQGGLISSIKKLSKDVYRRPWLTKHKVCMYILCVTDVHVFV